MHSEKPKNSLNIKFKISHYPLQEINTIKIKYINVAGQCATSLKDAGSITDNIPGIFYWHNPSGRTTDLGSTQTLKEICTRNIFWGVKASRTLDWQTCHHHMPTLWKTGSINLVVPYGPVIWLNKDCFTYTFHSKPSRLHFSERKLHVTENLPHVKFVACDRNMQCRQLIVPLEDSISSYYSTSSNRCFFRLPILCRCS
jgi:hypothetical protein